jgi:hypothetical protein
MRTFRARLQPFITEVARKRRLWEVHDRSLGVLYAIGQVDITDEVIKKAAPFFREQKELVGVEESLGAGATNAVGDEAVDEPEP